MNPDELRKYANLRGLNIGQAEKDYYQNIILFIIYGKTAKSLIFKGGTALAKCYGLNRFSEDLDFTINGGGNFINYITKGLAEFGINHTVKEMEKNTKYKIKIEGMLYKGTERTLCSITIDLSVREKVILEPVMLTIGHHMDIIPVFEVYVMDKEEIMAEKMRALMTRKSARDLYDLVFLIRSGTALNQKLANEKLKFYELEFDKSKLTKRFQLMAGGWDNELRSLVRNVPDFKEYQKEAKTFLER